MQLKITGSDTGIFVLGRGYLDSQETEKIEFKLTNEFEFKAGEVQESSFWAKGLQQIIEKVTRFGRIGVCVSRRNKTFLDFFEEFQKVKNNFEYAPKDKRAEKSPRLSMQMIPILKEMAHEGMADSVEFRRICRKYFRILKSHNCDTIFFPEAIFGEVKTKKILQHLAGTQIKVVTLMDLEVFQTPGGAQEIASLQNQNPKIEIINETEEPGFVRKQAETILKRKLRAEVI